MRFILSLLILLAVLAIPTASAQNATYYLTPVDSSVPDCTSTEVELRINTHGLLVAGGQVGLTYDASCANVTNFEFDTWLSPSPYSSWNYPDWDICWDRDGIGMDIDWIIWQDMFSNHDGDLLIGTFTINCSNPSGNCDYCTTELSLTCGEDGCQGCDIFVGDLDGNVLPYNISDNGGTFACGVLSTETFSKPLYKGWNLISLPLVPEDNNASVVLSTVPYDAVYRYDATSKQFESADVMNPGTGYFVHATTDDCIWEYDGAAYNSIDVSLEQGLNMVGWLNCSKDVDALSSISDYYYIARWDAAAEKFEVYNPAAPSAFNDFTTMDRGTGYFISAKQGCTLSESC